MKRPIHGYSALTVYVKYDPTKTTSLRNAFARDLKRRFAGLVAVIYKTIVTEDAFGLQEKIITLGEFTTPPRASFAFPRSADKIAKFNAWLDQQIKNGILEVSEIQGAQVPWTNRYITDSYKRGVQRARYELPKAGYDVPTIEQTGGIAATMTAPIHVDRLGILYTRSFEELKGVTNQMSTQISRVLSQGIADGDNPRVLANKMRATITGKGIGDLGITDTLGRFIPAERRAEMIARTEIIRAHHQGTIQEYKNWKAFGVVVQGEFKTAGDDNVCEECESLDGQKFPLDEVENLIPVHPNCRCVALPYLPENTIEEPAINMEE